MTPFQVVYGRAPPSLADYIPGSTTLQAVESALLDRTEVLQKLRNKLHKAQTTMKEIADQKRVQHTFQERDLVFVKLRPYRQNSVAGRRIHKLSKRYYGPYKLLKAIGDVAFQVELPPTSRIHPVFHVSQLKPCFGDVSASLQLPPETESNHPQIKPLAVLDWKQVDDTTPLQVLIQWDGLFPEDATWEDYMDIKATYPEFNLEDKVCLQGERDVMNKNDQDEDPKHYEEEVLAPKLRAKRNLIKPQRFKDYVMIPPKGRGKK